MQSVPVLNTICGSGCCIFCAVELDSSWLSQDQDPPQSAQADPEAGVHQEAAPEAAPEAELKATARGRSVKLPSRFANAAAPDSVVLLRGKRARDEPDTLQPAEAGPNAAGHSKRQRASSRLVQPSTLHGQICLSCVC